MRGTDVPGLGELLRALADPDMLMKYPAPDLISMLLRWSVEARRILEELEGGDP